MNLRADVFDPKDFAPTRLGFGQGLVEAADADPRIVGLSADLTESTKMDLFADKYPERFVQMGVAEQNLATVAAGMANYGKIPFITSYAAFSPGRNWEQIRTTVCINNVPVKIVGSHAGLLTGPDGATHQMLEDLALMRALPNMIVLSPCDAEEARKVTIAAALTKTPVYIRVEREKMPQMTTSGTPFTIGKANLLWDTEKPVAALFATGSLLHNALLAARELEGQGIAVTVTNVHTIKPIDRESIVREARRAGAVVSIEEHQINGGLGGAIAEVLAQECPTPMEFVAVKDAFGQSGTPSELIEHYGLGVSHIVGAVRKVITRN
ncbi:transketolase [Candidatus Kaiserbacteria bacterium RIFCSPHIGHO2_02_FULL_54_11b]|uniref:Transketolase n=2 Tax=Candidatus Kaiseribacteriota TaxID=1752734 RepID=A0A1F6CPK5_9BACT|nr:MAG: transketolase [Candidatus Kaiserbacteria bacterium RIFCSPHIGHO2_01_FULL_54_36b]OGG64253.1 MAG: transketolase [Candidatus Kaiserbacteria bacterium RIFCSPHIGHO2_02_FULL_54_11b]